MLPLTDIQIGDLSRYIAEKRIANLSDPGTRKTAPTNVYMWYLWNELKVKSLFIMPSGLFEQNRDSFFTFTPFKPEDIVVIEGSPAKRKELMKKDGKVFIAGFNFFNPLRTKQGLQPSDFLFLLNEHPGLKCNVVDEIHMGYANADNQRTNYWLGAVERYFQFVVMMTGTAVDGKLGTAYPIIRAIEPRYYADYKDFLRWHAQYDYFGSIVGWFNHGKIKEIFSRHAIRHSFEEVHGAESVVVYRQVTQMFHEHYLLYKELHNKSMIELEDKYLEITSGGQEALRARQILQCPESLGYAPEKIQNLKLQKDELLRVHIANSIQANKPMVIFSPFIAEHKRIANILREYLKPEEWGVINGEESMKRRNEVDANFKAGKIRIVVASPATCAVGYNWNHVDMMVFTTLDYKDSSFVQGYRRAIRGARKHPLLVYLLEYANSIDQRIYEIVENKMRLAKDIQDDKNVMNFTQNQKNSEPIKDPKGRLTMESF